MRRITDILLRVGSFVCFLLCVLCPVFKCLEGHCCEINDLLCIKQDVKLYTYSVSGVQ